MIDTQLKCLFFNMIQIHLNSTVKLLKLTKYMFMNKKTNEII